MARYPNITCTIDVTNVDELKEIADILQKNRPNPDQYLMLQGLLSAIHDLKNPPAFKVYKDGKEIDIKVQN